jgi:hypothetical protein
MIDSELYRQEHKKEYEAAWMAKNRAAILHALNAGRDGAPAPPAASGSPSSTAATTTMMLNDDDAKEFRQHARDVRMARDDPQRYCADRCIGAWGWWLLLCAVLR